VECLLERRAALAELTGLARTVRRGSGRVALLRGEAGVGKTALINTFTAALGGSERLLMGWCDPLAAPRPLGPLLDALAGFGPAAADGLVTAIESGDTGALYRRLLAILRDGQRWVWVIEDAHWADGSTLDLMRFLARRIASLPLLLVISYRDDEIDRQLPLSVALGDVATCAAVSRVALEPLSRDAVAVLAAGSGFNADQLHRLTGGNPFYVTEVLACGVDALDRNVLPSSVSEAVWGRLVRLSMAARETAQAVAVCGPRADAALVQKVCPAAGPALNECLDAGVLVADGDAIGFRHELARLATLSRIPDYRRRLLHKRALVALAEPPINPNVLPALVFHADQVGDGDAVTRHGPAAAERAAALGAHAEAAELYGLTLRHRGTARPEQEAQWLERHAFESYLCGLAAASMSSWRAAIGVRHQLGHRLEEGDDLRWLSHLLEPLGRTAEAIEAGRASLRLLDDLGPSPQLAWSLINMAHSCTVVSYDLAAAAEYAERALTLGVQLDDPAVVIRARGYQAMGRVFRGDTGWDDFEAVWRDALGGPVLTEHAAVLGVLISSAAALRREPARAEDYLTRAAAFCDDHDLVMFRALITGADALTGLHRGSWVEAALLAEQVLTRMDLSPQHRILPLVVLALIRARRGERPGSLLDEALESTAGNVLGLQVWAARAEAAWLAGDDDTALAEARAGFAARPTEADAWLVEPLRRWMCLAGGEPDDGGDWQAAAAAWTRRGCPYDAAIAALGGDIAAVESALATFRRLGARASARRAQQRLAALRGPTRRGPGARTLADPNGLTRRERQVLELLAAGKSDAQIAAALHISPKTAGGHVSSILVKLGVANRTQAATHARQSSDA
jgi:DNA-binding CsgD family transcriptional regulator/tetratricopeptide (TPR) repeat protein